VTRWILSQWDRPTCAIFFTINYRLHGHSIFTLTVNDETGDTFIYLSSCGWRSVTTKERLNALLGYCLPGYSLRQVKGGWYIYDALGIAVPFFNGIRYSIN